MGSAIEWTDETWNPTVGCSKVSPGCDNCYAMRMAARFSGLPESPYYGTTSGGVKVTATVMRPKNRPGPDGGFTRRVVTEQEPMDWSGVVHCLPERLDQPARWRKPRRVFVDSMSDLFHPGIPVDFIAEVFMVMQTTPRHTFQVLTKRPQRMAAAVNEIADLLADVGEPWPAPNIWLGTSVEDQRYAELRIPHLLATPAAVRFLSIEPLLGPVTFRWAKWEGMRGHNHLDGLRQLDWVIVGGESGPGARPMHPDWVRTIRDECAEAGVPFFFKQWGKFAPMIEGTRSSGYGYVMVDPDGAWRRAADALPAPEAVAMADMGKKAAGRELDGRTWDEYPVPSPGAES